MAKQKAIEQDGEVIEALPNAQFRVRLENGHEILGLLSDFAIEPMINQGSHVVSTGPDGWTIRTADGAPSAHYEHMVVVRRGQPEILSTFTYIEDVIDAPYNKAALTNG